MSAAKIYNLARMTTATTGTGTITLGGAVSGFLSFAGAGVANGDTVYYAISDGANSEVGTGVYTSSGTTLTRTVLKSTNSNTAISLSGSAQVAISAIAETIDFSSTFCDVSKDFTAGGVFSVGAAFTALPLTTVNSDVGSHWDSVNRIYVVSQDGTYMITASIRVGDATYNSSSWYGDQLGIGVHTSSIDGDWFIWTQVAGSPTIRSTAAYSRIMRCSVNDALRLYSYSDQGVSVCVAGLKIIRIA